MHRTRLPLVLLLSALPLAPGALSPGVAHAGSNGAWATFLRAYTYTDLLADSSSVWCASLEGSLVRFDRAAGTLETVVREPGGLASNHLTALAQDRSGRLWVGTQGAGLSYLSADRTRWNLLNEFDGLPSDTVNVVTPEGDTLWIGTPAGLTLWDGSEVLGTLPDGVNPSPFGSNDVRGVVVAGDALFVATGSGVYLALQSQSLAVWEAVNDGLPNRNVERLVSDGRDLFAYSSDTTWKVPYRLSGSTWVSPPGLTNVRTIDADRGTILVMTSSGMFRWNGSSYDQIPGAPASRLAVQRWVRPAIAPDGRIYAANSDGFYEQGDAGGPWTTYRPVQPPGNNIVNLALQGARLYVNTYDEGVGRFDGAAWKNWPPGPCQSCDTDTTFLNGAFTFALLVDRRGTKWIGAWGETAHPDATGAIELVDDAADPPQFTHLTSWPGGLARARHTFAISATLDSAGGHWFGMDSPERETPDFTPIGIDYYDSSGVFVANFSPSNSAVKTGRILALTTDKTGVVWVGTTGKGIQRLYVDDHGQLQSETGDDRPLDVRGLVAVGGTVWAQTTNDIRAYGTEGAGFRGSFPVPAGPSDNAGHPLEAATDGTIWAGTNNGIRVYRRDGSVLQDFTTANSPLASDDVRAIRTDPATGVLWIGTSAGLNRYDPNYVVPPPPVVSRLAARVYPNPARLTALGIDLRILGNTSGYRGTIYDLNGRMVHEFSGAANGAGIWDGLDRDGRRVQPGIYFLRVHAGGRSAVVRIALLR